MKLTKPGATIKAGRVLAIFVEIKTLPVKRGSSTHKIQRWSLRQYARCIVERPMVEVKKPEPAKGFLRQPEDELEAEQIYAEARRCMAKPAVRSRDRSLLQRRILEGTVRCIIEKPLKISGR